MLFRSDFFDAVDRGDPAPIRFEARGLRVALRWNELERAQRGRLFQYRVVRAIAHARTLSLRAAEAQLRAVLATTPDAWLAWQNLALVLAADDRWGDAVVAAEEAARHDPANPVPRALRERIATLRDQIRSAPSDPSAREAATIRALIALRLTLAARRRLDAAVSVHGPSPDRDALRAELTALDDPSTR